MSHAKATRKKTIPGLSAKEQLAVDALKAQRLKNLESVICRHHMTFGARLEQPEFIHATVTALAMVGFKTERTNKGINVIDAPEWLSDFLKLQSIMLVKSYAGTPDPDTTTRAR